jgi:hypothetical protein
VQRLAEAGVKIGSVAVYRELRRAAGLR